MYVVGMVYFLEGFMITLDCYDGKKIPAYYFPLHRKFCDNVKFAIIFHMSNQLVDSFKEFVIIKKIVKIAYQTHKINNYCFTLYLNFSGYNLRSEN